MDKAFAWAKLPAALRDKERRAAGCREMSAVFTRYDQYWLALAALLCWCCVFREYFLFDRLFLFHKNAVDTISQFYPIEYFRIKNGLALHVPFWSFQFGLGENVYSLTTALNPFNILYWFFGPEHFSEAIAFDILLKFLTAALFFQAFLKRIGLARPVAFFGSLAYVFSGHMLVNCHWYHYPNYAVFAAMFLYFFELWFQDGIWTPMALLVGLLSIKLEYQILQIAFFGFFYVLYRLFNTVGWSRKTLSTLLRLIGFYALGLLIWSYFLLPDIYRYFYSDRVQGAFAQVASSSLLGRLLQPVRLEELVVILARFFSPDALSSWLGYQGVLGFFEDSSMYVGMAALLFAAAPFFLKDRDRKLLWIFPTIIAVLIALPYARNALVAFVSMSFKHLSLYCGFYLLFSALIVLQIFCHENDERRIATIKRVVFATWLIVALAFLNVHQHPRFGPLKFNLHRFDVSMALLSALTLALLLYGKKRRKVLTPFVYVLLVLDLMLSARVVAAKNPGIFSPFFEQRREVYFNADTRAALDAVKRGDSGFFRVEKNYSDFDMFPNTGLNDAMVQGHFGVTAYLAFPGRGLRQFHAQYGLTRSRLAYQEGLEDVRPLRDLLLVKYLLHRGADAAPPGFSHRGTFGNVRLYRNETVDSFGRMFHRRIAPEAFEALALEERRRGVPDFVVCAEPVPGVAQADGPPPPDAERPADAFRLASWTEERFVGDIEVTRPGILFFPIPHDIGWQARVDGKKAPLLRLNYAFFGLAMTDLGHHRVELRYRPPFMALGWCLTALGLLLTFLLWRRSPRIAPY